MEAESQSQPVTASLMRSWSSMIQGDLVAVGFCPPADGDLTTATLADEGVVADGERISFWLLASLSCRVVNVDVNVELAKALLSSTPALCRLDASSC